MRTPSLPAGLHDRVREHLELLANEVAMGGFSSRARVSDGGSRPTIRRR